MKRYASARQYELASAIADMAARYGLSLHRAGMAHANGRGASGGKTADQWSCAASRQYRALLRLTNALRDAEVAR